MICFIRLNSEKSGDRYQMSCYCYIYIGINVSYELNFIEINVWKYEKSNIYKFDNLSLWIQLCYDYYNKNNVNLTKYD